MSKDWMESIAYEMADTFQKEFLEKMETAYQDLLKKLTPIHQSH